MVGIAIVQGAGGKCQYFGRKAGLLLCLSLCFDLALEVVMRSGYLMLAAVLGLTACSKEPPPVTPKADTGRPETRNIEGADAMGYNGKAIRQQLDNSLNTTDDYNKKVEEQANP
jgi:hypothetical protein